MQPYQHPFINIYLISGRLCNQLNKIFQHLLCRQTYRQTTWQLEKIIISATLENTSLLLLQQQLILLLQLSLLSQWLLLLPTRMSDLGLKATMFGLGHQAQVLVIGLTAQGLALLCLALALHLVACCHSMQTYQHPFINTHDLENSYLVLKHWSSDNGAWHDTETQQCLCWKVSK